MGPPIHPDILLPGSAERTVQERCPRAPQMRLVRNEAAILQGEEGAPRSGAVGLHQGTGGLTERAVFGCPGSSQRLRIPRCLPEGLLIKGR